MHIQKNHTLGDPDAKRGFTLIELSIVLVIIGLIVGGVLVGQDLIKAAEIRALISQVEKYNSAVNTFQGKFNSKPGDITATSTGAAAQFGLSYETTSGGAVGHGDGNGLIEGGSAGATAFIGETLYFWKHLGEANMVDGAYGAVGPSAPTATDGTPSNDVTEVAQSLPQAKLGPAGSITVYSVSGLNYYQVVPISGIDSAGAFTFNNSGMTPVQAYNIDAKLDDGAPITGIVRAKALSSINGTPSAAATSTVGRCVIGDGTSNTDTYNRVAASGGNSPSCSIRLRFN